MCGPAPLADTSKAMSGFSSLESNPLYNSRPSKRSLGTAGSPTTEEEEEVLLSGSIRTPPILDSEGEAEITSTLIMTGKNDPLVFSNRKHNYVLGEKLPVWKKLAYAVGSMPYAMCVTVLGFYFSIFLLEVVIMDATYVLIIIFSGRAWDAITDPVVGFMTSYTNTRFGRLRPWLACSMVPVGIIYFFVWFVPPPLVDSEDYVKYIYYQVMYLLFQASLTCIHVPYTALTMHMTNDIKERDSVTLYRMCFEVGGTMVGVFVYTAYYLGLVGSSNSGCEGEGGKRQSDPDLRAAYHFHSLTLGLITVACIFTTFITVREQKEEMHKDKRIGFFRGLKETVGFKPYFYLLMLELFSWVGLQFIQGNLALYIKYSVGLETQYPYLIAVLLISTILAMPLWQLVIVKFGKKTAYYVGMWTLLPLLLFLLFADKAPWASYLMNFFGGLGVSCAYLLPWSMLPDVVDEAALKNDVRREELFYAFFVFGNKFGSGITLGLSTAIYKIAGYDQNQCDQPWTVPLTLKLLVTIPPVILILISFIFLHLYPITEKTRQRTKLLLAQKRKRIISDDESDNDLHHSGRPTMSTIAKTAHEHSFEASVPVRPKGFSKSNQTGF